MNKSDLTFGGTFCVLPWVEHYTNLSGHQQFCCWSDQTIENHQQADQLRKQIWNRQQISHCTTCYNLEANKIISPRQKETIRWFKDQDVKNYFNVDVCPDVRPLFLDLRVSNKCNLACISCGPKYSSLWAKELNVESKSQHQLINFDNLSRYKKIYMSGGEPLIVDDNIKILNFIADNNLDTEIVINTNLTNLSQAVLTAIGKIQNISITVSVDAFGNVNEYHRYPLKWSKFMTNLNAISQSSIRIDFNTVVDAVSIFGLGELLNIAHIPQSWNLSILRQPAWLELKNIPVQYKDLALENLLKFKQNKFYNKDIVFKTRINQIQQEISQHGNSDILSEQIKILDLRRKINHINYLGINLI